MHKRGRLAQLVEHLLYTQGVGSSSLSPPISVQFYADSTTRIPIASSTQATSKAATQNQPSDILISR